MKANTEKISIDEQKAHDAQWVMSTIQGRRFIWELLSQCGIYRELEGDMEAMLKQEGRRQVGLRLLGHLTNVDEDLVFEMMRESRNQKLEENYNAGRPKRKPEPEYDELFGYAAEYYSGGEEDGDLE